MQLSPVCKHADVVAGKDVDVFKSFLEIISCFKRGKMQQSVPLFCVTARQSSKL